MAEKKPTFEIKHPGALTNRAARNDRSVSKQAHADKDKPGLQGTQARLYVNVFSKANRERAKKSR